MKKNIYKFVVLNFILIFWSCSGRQEARRPLKQISGEFLKESVERNKELNKNEEFYIQNLIKNDSVLQFKISQKGYWFAYESKSETPTASPKKGDIAVFEYEVFDLKGNLIYSKNELKLQQYVVDKQEIMIGLRDGLMQMQKGQKVKFIFPSNLAYGYHGDKNKIGSNTPIICKVNLIDIKKEISKPKKITETKKINNDSTQINNQ